MRFIPLLRNEWHRLRLYIGRDYPRAFRFEDKQTGEIHRFCIQRVYLMDIWAETEKSFSDPRHLEGVSEADLLEMKKTCFEQLARLCPRGMYLPVIEHEAEGSRNSKPRLQGNRALIC